MDRNTTWELAEAIIGQPPPAALTDWVSQRARGNPLYVISLVRALLEEHADLSAPSLRRLPEGLTERDSSFGFVDALSVAVWGRVCAEGSHGNVSGTFAA